MLVLLCSGFELLHFPHPQRAGVLKRVRSAQEAPTPTGVGELRRTSSAALWARHVGLFNGVLTLVLCIWKAEIRFLVLEALRIRLSD